MSKVYFRTPDYQYLCLDPATGAIDQEDGTAYYKCKMAKIPHRPESISAGEISSKELGFCTEVAVGTVPGNWLKHFIQEEGK